MPQANAMAAPAGEDAPAGLPLREDGMEADEDNWDLISDAPPLDATEEDAEKTRTAELAVQGAASAPHALI